MIEVYKRYERGMKEVYMIKETKKVLHIPVLLDL